MKAVQGMAQRRGNWVQESEHIVLRVVSLIFSVGSSYAIRWFFEPLDTGDPIHYVLWWGVAAGFGILGFYLSRSLMYRMMVKEPIWPYAPVFLLVEFFEVLCNYAKAVTAVAAGAVPWVAHAPSGQQGFMTALTYIGWSIIPLVAPTMAVADMDMTRRRNGEVKAASPQGFQPVGKSTLPPLPPNSGGGARNQGPRQGQGVPPGASGAPTQRYQPVQPVQPAKANGRTPQNGVIVEDL